jgi:5-methylcytosine-specific restriction endonuclease McrA
MVSHLKKHTKLYLAYFGFDVSDFIPCEICNAQAVDIHHIECRGMGGTKEVENIDNLMAVCRSCHIKYGDKKEYKEFLKEVHNDYKYRGGN